MKKLLVTSLLMALASPCWATLALVQHKITGNCTLGVNCAVTVTKVKAANTLVVGISLAGADSAITLASITGDAACSAAISSADATGGAISLCYILSATGGETSITVVPSSATSAAYKAEVLEFSGVAILFDTSGTSQFTSATTKPTGTALTLSGTNDVIVQWVKAQNNATSINGGYATQDINGGFSVAISLNNTVGTAPQWLTVSGRAATVSIAFKDSGGTGGMLRAGPSNVAGPTFTQ